MIRSSIIPSLSKLYKLMTSITVSHTTLSSVETTRVIAQHWAPSEKAMLCFNSNRSNIGQIWKLAQDTRNPISSSSSNLVIADLLQITCPLHVLTFSMALFMIQVMHRYRLWLYWLCPMLKLTSGTTLKTVFAALLFHFHHSTNHNSETHFSNTVNATLFSL